MRAHADTRIEPLEGDATSWVTITLDSEGHGAASYPETRSPLVPDPVPLVCMCDLDAAPDQASPFLAVVEQPLKCRHRQHR